MIDNLSIMAEQFIKLLRKEITWNEFKIRITMLWKIK